VSVAMDIRQKYQLRNSLGQSGSLENSSF
jgi:hypothetical protein